VPRGTLVRYVKDTSLSPEEVVNVHVGRRTVLPSELENELLEYRITMDQRCYVWIEMSGHKTHGFTSGNKTWFEPPIKKINK
jgi:radical SAM superfamily enzyme